MGFLYKLFISLRTNLYLKHKKKKEIYTHTNTKKKENLVNFTYHNPLIHKVTNLFKNTNFKIAFRTKKHHIQPTPRYI